MFAGTSLDVDAELETLAKSLAEELNGAVPRAEIERSIREERDRFGDPPITQFLPILIERKVRSSFR